MSVTFQYNDSADTAAFMQTHKTFRSQIVCSMKEEETISMPFY
jgi:hypothetical protein